MIAGLSFGCFKGGKAIVMAEINQLQGEFATLAKEETGRRGPPQKHTKGLLCFVPRFITLRDGLYLTSVLVTQGRGYEMGERQC